MDTLPRGLVIIADSEPTEFFTGNAELRKLRPEYYLWLNPNTGEYKWWNPATELWDLIPVKEHTHNYAQIDHIHSSVNLEKKIGNETFIFENGILVKVDE